MDTKRSNGYDSIFVVEFSFPGDIWNYANSVGIGYLGEAERSFRKNSSTITFDGRKKTVYVRNSHKEDEKLLGPEKYELAFQLLSRLFEEKTGRKLEEELSKKSQIKI